MYKRVYTGLGLALKDGRGETMHDKQWMVAA